MADLHPEYTERLARALETGHLDDDSGGHDPAQRRRYRRGLRAAHQVIAGVWAQWKNTGHSVLTEEDAIVLSAIGAMASETATEILRIRWAQSPGNAQKLREGDKLAGDAEAQTKLFDID